MGVVLFFLVEHPRAKPVERLQVGLDARGLVGLLSRILTNEELRIARCALVAQQWLEHLLIKRVLQLIVFNVPVHVGLARHVLVQLKVPAYELGVGFASEKALNYVIHPLVLTHQPQSLGAACLLLAVGICGVAIADKEAELLQGRYLAERQVLKYLALSNGVVEVLALLGAHRDLREYAVYLLFCVLLLPCAAPVPVADVHHIPTVGERAGARYAAVFGDDVSAPQHQGRLRDGARGIQCLFGPLPLLVQRHRISAILVGVIVVEVQHVWADGLVAHATRRRSSTQGDELRSACAGELLVGPCAYGFLLAVKLHQARVLLKVSLIGREQTRGGIDGGRRQCHEPLTFG